MAVSCQSLFPARGLNDPERSRKLLEQERDSPPSAVPQLHAQRFSSGETRNYLFPASSVEREDTAARDSVIHQRPSGTMGVLLRGSKSTEAGGNL